MSGSESNINRRKFTAGALALASSTGISLPALAQKLAALRKNNSS